MNYKHNISELVKFHMNKNDNVIGSISYEHNGKIYMVNKGVRVKSKSSNEISLQTFNFCSACAKRTYKFIEFLNFWIITILYYIRKIGIIFLKNSLERNMLFNLHLRSYLIFGMILLIIDLSKRIMKDIKPTSMIY